MSLWQDRKNAFVLKGQIDHLICNCIAYLCILTFIWNIRITPLWQQWFTHFLARSHCDVLLIASWPRHMALFCCKYSRALKTSLCDLQKTDIGHTWEYFRFIVMIDHIYQSDIKLQSSASNGRGENYWICQAKKWHKKLHTTRKKNSIKFNKYYFFHVLWQDPKMINFFSYFSSTWLHWVKGLVDFYLFPRLSSFLSPFRRN